MKKVLCFLLIVLFTFGIIGSAFAIDIDLSSLTEKELKQLKGQIEKELSTRAAASSLASGDIGDYHIDILSVEMIKDMLGAEAVSVNYLFTNNSRSSASFMMDISAKVYQDGVECSETYTLDSLDFTKEVQAGGTLNITKAYSLNNDYDDITIEIGEGFNFYGSNTPSLSFTLELP